MKRLWILVLLAACKDGGDRTVVVGSLFLENQVRVNALGGGRLPRICCDGETVYAVWSDDRNDPDGDRDVFFNVSTNGGLTWLPDDIQLDTDGPGTRDSIDVEICCSGPRVYVAWADDRSDPGENRDVYLNYSEDGGLTWQASDIRLDTDDPGDNNSNRPQICCDGQYVYVVWEDARAGRGGLWSNASTDGGATWLSSDVRVDPGDDVSEGVTVGCVGTTVYAAWRDEGFSTGIHFRKSTDAGQTWTLGTIKLDTNTGDVDPPLLCADGQRIYAVWPDFRDDVCDIFFNASLDGGTTWLGDRRLNVQGGSESTFPRVCCDGLDVYVLWVDDRRGVENLFFNRSTDGGTTWEADDIRVDAASPGTGLLAGGPVIGPEPEMCCGGGRVYVAWRDYRLDPEGDVYFNYSLDGGLTWQAEDARVDTTAPASDRPDSFRICCDAGRVYVVWDLLPDADVYFNRATP